MKRITFLFLASCLLVLSVGAQTKVICHRGFWLTPGSTPNSLVSFSKADSIGAFGSEFDVWMTDNGKLVVNHDKNFKGVNMATSRYSDIRDVLLDNGEQLPTLKEYLKNAKEHPNTHIILEYKSLPSFLREDEAVEKIVKLVKKYKLLDRTNFIAFSLNACFAFRKFSPSAKVYYLGGNITPMMCKSFGFAGIDYLINTLNNNPTWVKDSHKLGLEVNVWTVDKKSDMEKYISLGVDYITTDYPVLLQSLVEKNTK